VAFEHRAVVPGEQSTRTLEDYVNITDTGFVMRLSKLFLLLVVALTFLTVGSCNLGLFGDPAGDSDESIAIPAMLQGISAAETLVVTGSAARGARSTGAGSGLVGIDANGNEIDLTFTDDDGDPIDYQVSYAFRPTADHLIVVRNETSSGADIQLSAGIVLVEISTESVYTLTPPLVQEALDHVAEAPDSRRAYGQLGFGGWRSGRLQNGDFWPRANAVPDWQRLLFVDVSGNLFYQMASEIIVDTYDEGGINEYGSGDWLYSEELIAINMTDYTQQVLFAGSDTVGGWLLESGVSGYFMDLDGTKFYSIRISDTQQVHYRVDPDGTREVLANAPDIYGARFFRDSSGATVFVDQVDYSQWSVKEFQRDGSSQTLVSLPSRNSNFYSGVAEDVIVGNKRYFLGGETEPVLYEYFADGTVQADMAPVTLPGTEQINGAAAVGNVVFVLATGTDGTAKLFRVPSDTEVVTEILMPGYIPTGLTATPSELMVGAFSLADSINGVISVETDGTVGSFSSFSFGGSSSEPLPLIPLN